MLHKVESVINTPTLNQLASSYFVNAYAIKGDLLTGRRYTPKYPLMSASQLISNNYFIILCNHILKCKLPVGETCIHS